jgi:hypothetical protein
VRKKYQRKERKSNHKPTMLTPTTGLPSLSWETGSELLTLMDLEKMVDERGFEFPGLLIANSGENKLRQGATIT